MICISSVQPPERAPQFAAVIAKPLLFFNTMTHGAVFNLCSYLREDIHKLLYEPNIITRRLQLSL